MAAAREQFSRVAEKYATSKAHSDNRFLARIVALAAPSKGARVLDVATGPGFVAHEFARNGFEVVGTDITKEMILHARKFEKTAAMDLVLAEAVHQPFRNGTFDVAVSRLAFHHLKDPAMGLESMRSLVRPGGKVVLADLVVSEDDEIAEFHNRFERFRDPSHERSLKLSEWKRMFRETGLQLDRVARSKVDLELREWAERAGLPKTKFAELSEMLERAPPRTRRALSVSRRNGTLFFKNTRAILVGVKNRQDDDIVHLHRD